MVVQDQQLVVRFTVTWGDNPRRHLRHNPGTDPVKAFYLRAAVFPSRLGDKPPTGLSAKTRTQYPTVGQEEDCVLVKMGTVYFAYPAKG